MTPADLDALAPGPAADAAVAECFEPKPPPMTYREAERIERSGKNGGWASCFTVHSPKGYWKIEVDWGTIERARMQDDVAEWQSATEYTSEDDPAAAMELLETLPCYTLRKDQIGYCIDLPAEGEGRLVFALAKELPLCAVRAFLKSRPSAVAAEAQARGEDGETKKP